MPCYDGYDLIEKEEAKAKYDKAKARLDKVTRLLCLAGQVYRGQVQPTTELLSWWEQHRKDDAEREARDG